MQKLCSCVICVLLSVLSAATSGETVTFSLMAHKDNVQQLPQPKGQVGTGGDHLLQTADDITGQTFNPDGCWSFNFTNPVGVLEPDYPAGYVEGIHSMTGSVVLNMDLVGGGAVGIDSLAFDGYVAPQKPIARQRMINPGDPATDGNHGPVDGLPNSGSYTADAASNWNFAATFDWCYDTPFAGSGTIDMTFNNYQWSGFIIPVSELTPAGMAATTLDDPLGYFGGTSQDFESWLLDEVAARLPAGAQYLLFTQGEAQPNWTHPMMGMTTDGIVGETIVAYAVPEPSTVLFFVAGLYGLAAVRRSLRGRDE